MLDLKRQNNEIAQKLKEQDEMSVWKRIFGKSPKKQKYLELWGRELCCF